MTAKIRRALLSVSDKTGLIEFATALQSLHIDLVSTGGTARALREAGLVVRDVSEVTGVPEIFGGRVKTLHPMIHGGILAVRGDSEHQHQASIHGIPFIDLVVVNLYPFAATVNRDDVTVTEVLENIDIGGPAMIRAAAKNFPDVAVVVDPADYPAISAELAQSHGSLSLATTFRLAQKAFAHTAAYDSFIADFFASRLRVEREEIVLTSHEPLPPRLTITLTRQQPLRYGENPHQQAALYRLGGDEPGVAAARQLQGKELSFNNFLDLDAAWSLVSDFSEPACVIIKHTNPCGAARAGTVAEAFRQALATDPVSAFGGIVGVNRPVDGPAAEAMSEIFLEAIIAPGYDPEALSIFSRKKNLRVMEMVASSGTAADAARYDLKRIRGGVLLQTRDEITLKPDQLRVVTERAPSDEEYEALLFAWTICKHVKSNAIVYARPNQLVAVGAGQMSRVDSVKLGAMKALLPLEGTVLASDAFFPFRDGIDEAARHGVRAVIQPGGSIRDAEVIAAANEHGLAMVFTGVRHFKH
ncbi:MAG TPA: bifunctional phosphoribosylaminoimidazolecarboxamide formyltransferase/IMP cyclohydrolase [Blastocatellia bacterium]|nr:bifunctional phosphoribosylaminoimidazolecarboxamide formyltransferase/IMP cyclohydrolase [Blastocatellia bacterium]